MQFHNIFQGHGDFLEALSSNIEVHSTFHNLEKTNNTILPSRVINHGILTSIEYQELLEEAKVIIYLLILKLI